jgi:acyl-CoA dehydrogenase
MADLDILRLPLNLLKTNLPAILHLDMLESEQQWWASAALPISEAVDRAGTPWVRMYDRFGKRVDEILFIPEYLTMLRRGFVRA